MMVRAEASLQVLTCFASQLLHESRRTRFTSQMTVTYKRARGSDMPYMITSFSNLAFNVPVQKVEKAPQLLPLEDKGST